MNNTYNLLKLWFKEYFSSCQAQSKYIEKDKLFLICGHRGSPVKEIENTIPSFESAIAEGANSLEIDLCLTKDNEVVLWHDWDPNGTNAILREAGFEPWVKYKPHPPDITNKFRKPIRELYLKDFLEHFDYKGRKEDHKKANAEIPTLNEFMKWAKNKKQLKKICFDVKTPGAEAEYAIPILISLKALISEYNPDFDPIIETTEPSVLKLLKKKFPEFSYALDIESPAGLVLDPKEHSSVSAAIENRNSYAIALRPRKITIANFTTYRRIIRYDVQQRVEYNNNSPVKSIEAIIGCTVNKKKELNCLVKLGIDGIQTDFPERLKKIALKYGRKIE